jgi:putative SOS response-associated peptidase YedK
MCGRYALYSSPHAVALQFGLAREPAFTPSYNIAPGRVVLAIRAHPDGSRHGVALAWGLTPAWAHASPAAHHHFNARADHLAQKPSFRDALSYRRCIVPADGFYEWHAAGGQRTPYYVQPEDGGLVGLAGNYEIAANPAGTCAIVTVAANAALAHLNARMPAILGVADYAHWLDPDHPDPLSLVDTLRPAPTRFTRAARVSRRVNQPQHDDPGLIVPVPPSASRADDELF